MWADAFIARLIANGYRIHIGLPLIDAADLRHGGAHNAVYDVG
jgi:hypothetical protein